MSLTVIVCFFLTTLGPLPAAHADSVLGLPPPGTMINLSPAYVPVLIKGLIVHPENPLLFDFILDTGKSGLKIDSPEFKSEAQKLIKYFLASLTIKEDDQWVNLSPYEKNHVVPEELGKTELGRDMLAQDYILKQLTASLIYPEKELGKVFWDKVYTKARQMFGTTNVPVNTFNKVWIVADKANILERDNAAYIVGSHLKVMLEEDYLALDKHSGVAASSLGNTSGQDTHSVASQIVRGVVLPELEKEVNQGKNFALLRQMFYSMIMATWYKMALKDALLNQVYSNKAKTGGVLSDDPAVKEKIYEQYLKAYKRGVFNYIKEDLDAISQQTMPRKYFSGGVGPDFNLRKPGVINRRKGPVAYGDDTGLGPQARVSVLAKGTNPDAAMLNLDVDVSTQPLLQFYLGLKVDHKDRKISDMWGYDYDTLENEHDIIQLMFPSNRMGMFFQMWVIGVPQEKIVWPQLVIKDVDIWRGDTKTGRRLRANMLRSLEVMLDFYGFRFNLDDPNQVTIEQGDNFKKRKKVWLTEGNHNFLRIDRILNSLKFVGLEKYSLMFFDALSKVHDKYKEVIDASDSFTYWENSVKNIERTGNLTLEEHQRNVKGDEAMLANVEEFKVLIREATTQEDLKRIYRRMAKEFHPDKFFAENDENKKAAEEIFKELKELYELVERQLDEVFHIKPVKKDAAPGKEFDWLTSWADDYSNAGDAIEALKRRAKLVQDRGSEGIELVTNLISNNINVLSIQDLSNLLDTVSKPEFAKKFLNLTAKGALVPDSVTDDTIWQTRPMIEKIYAARMLKKGEIVHFREGKRITRTVILEPITRTNLDLKAVTVNEDDEDKIIEVTQKQLIGPTNDLERESLQRGFPLNIGEIVEVDFSGFPNFPQRKVIATLLRVGGGFFTFAAQDAIGKNMKFIRGHGFTVGYYTAESYLKSGTIRKITPHALSQKEQSAKNPKLPDGRKIKDKVEKLLVKQELVDDTTNTVVKKQTLEAVMPVMGQDLEIKIEKDYLEGKAGMVLTTVTFVRKANRGTNVQTAIRRPIDEHPAETAELVVDLIDRHKSFDVENDYYSLPMIVSELSVKGGRDAAMKADQAMPGGIDLNSKNMGLDVAKDGQGIEMKFDPAMVAEFQKGNFTGVQGIILRIVPIESPLPIFGFEMPVMGGKLAKR